MHEHWPLKQHFSNLMHARLYHNIRSRTGHYEARGYCKQERRQKKGNSSFSFSSILNIPYLMFVVVKLIAIARLKYFEAVWAKKIDCVLVELSEVNDNVIVERGAEIANLKTNTPHSTSKPTSMSENRFQFGKNGLRRISGRMRVTWHM